MKISITAPAVYNTIGLTHMAIVRDSDSLTLMEWTQQGKDGGTVEEQPQPVFAHVWDEVPLVGGSTYSLQFAAEVSFGGTSTLDASSTAVVSIAVEAE